jgi:hypothetical protein
VFDNTPEEFKAKLLQALEVYKPIAASGWQIGFGMLCEGSPEDADGDISKVVPTESGAVMFHGPNVQGSVKFDGTQWLNPEAHREAASAIGAMAMAFGYQPYAVAEPDGYKQLRDELVAAAANVSEFIGSLPVELSDVHQLALLSDLKFKLGRVVAGCDAFGK